MKDEINTPYSWEIEFYTKNNIPVWECKTHKTKNLGRIYESNDGSYIETKVNPMPAQFFEFKIFCGESQKEYCISTGSGDMETYFPIMKNIADGMIDITSLTKNESAVTAKNNGA